MRKHVNSSKSAEKKQFNRTEKHNNVNPFKLDPLDQYRHLLYIKHGLYTFNDLFLYK